MGRSSTVNPLLDRVRGVLLTVGVTQAVLSHPETLASLGVFENPEEDWPVATPFAPVRALLVLGPTKAILVVADFHACAAQDRGVRIAANPSYSYERELDPPAELLQALSDAKREAGFAPGATGIESMHLPWLVASWLAEKGHSPVACDETILAARVVKIETELNAIRRASRLADVVQQSIKDNAAPGRRPLAVVPRARTDHRAGHPRRQGRSIRRPRPGHRRRPDPRHDRARSTR